MEDSETISAVGMSMIILENSYLFVFWANACVSRWSDGVLLEIIPIGISIRSGGMISDEVIIWVSDPNCSWCLIGIEKTPGSLGHHDKVALDKIPSLDTIFNEDRVTFGVKCNIVNNPQVLGSVNGESSIERLVN